MAVYKELSRQVNSLHMAARIGAAQRRARLAQRHRLAPDARAATAADVARSLVAVHATDPATVFLSIGARLATPSIKDIDEGLYGDGCLVRMHGMRRTVFVVPAQLAPVIHHAATLPIAIRERKQLLKFVHDGGFDERWLADVEERALQALHELGEATAAELSAREPRLKEQVVVAPDKPYAAKFAVGTRLLTTLGMEGRVVRRRPRGTWNSNQFRWTVAPAAPPMPEAQARMELARRWLATFGPGTEADLKWWSGWSLTHVRSALSAVDAQQVLLDDGPGFVLPGDVETAPSAESWAALLPALDSTAMGWQQRSWYLPDAMVKALFDRTGNVGPTVWWNGAVVGGWAHRPGGEVAYRLLTDPGREAKEAIEAEAQRLMFWLGGATVTPRFRTPLERELSA